MVWSVVCVVCCLLFVCVLRDVCCVLSVVACLMVVVRCVLFLGSWLLVVVC